MPFSGIFRTRKFLLTPPMKLEQTVFRNVCTQNSDAGKSPKRKNTAFRRRQKFEVGKEIHAATCRFLIFVINCIVISEFVGCCINPQNATSNNLMSTLPLWPTCPPQHPILKHPQPIFFLNVSDQVSNPYNATVPKEWPFWYQQISYTTNKVWNNASLNSARVPPSCMLAVKSV